MPYLGWGFDLIEKRERHAGINGSWYRRVGETLPQTIATPTAVWTGPHQDDLASLGPDVVVWIWPEKMSAAKSGRFTDPIRARKQRKRYASAALLDLNGMD